MFDHITKLTKTVGGSTESIEKKQNKQYFLFWSHRGYMEQEVFDTKEEAIKKYKEVHDGYSFPTLIYGEEVLFDE